MPSTEHDALARMFRQRPGLAPEILSILFGMEVPAGTEARRESIEGTAVLRVLYAALKELDPDDAQLYYDAVADGLARDALKILKEFTMTSAAIVPNDPRAVALRRLMEGAAAEAEAKGEAKGVAESILTVLGACGVEVSDDARRRIIACTDLDQLGTWLNRALKVSSTKELFDSASQC